MCRISVFTNNVAKDINMLLFFPSNNFISNLPSFISKIAKL